MTRREFMAAIAAEAALRGQTVGGKTALGGLTALGGGGAAALAKLIFSVGQSLAEGGAGDPSRTHTQPYTNRMWNGGNLWQYYPEFPGVPVASITSLVPLIEGVSHDNESHMSAMANQLATWARAAGMGATWDTINASFARGATAYDGLKRGTEPYDASMASLDRALLLLGSVNVPAVVCVHGEADGSCAYKPKVVEWQADMETDIKAKTGQTGTIPMFISQVQIGECDSGADYSGMLGAFMDHPTKIILVCPKYMFSYAVSVHLDNQDTGYIWMGEYYAKAIWQQLVLGQQWQGVRPTSVTVVGNKIVIQHTVPTPPLVFDTTLVAQLADGNYGFEYDGVETITNVAITDPTNGIVEITLSGAPTANGHCVKYAFSGTPTGAITGVRGCLRDSDSTVSRTGNTLHNWCFHYSMFKAFP